MNRIPIEWPIRLGCGFVNLYSGYFLLTDPARYYSFVPEWLASMTNSIASVDAYLRLQGAGEVVIAIILLGWFFPRVFLRVAALALVLEMTLIVLFIGVDSVTFRNVGLLGAALSIVVSSFQDNEASRAEAEETAFSAESHLESTRL